jgi:hypothetical protein
MGAGQAVGADGVKGGLRRFFWMDERLALAREKAFGPGCPGWEEFELGRAAMADADYLADPDRGRITALLLCRTAAGLLARAQLARIGVDPGPTATPEDCWALLAEHPFGSSLLARATEEERSSLSSAMGFGGRRWLARLPPKERAKTMRALGRLTRGVAAPMEADARRVRDVWLVRWVRIVGSALALCLGILVILAGITRLTAPPNLALHKRVTVVTPHPGVAVGPDALVDGNRSNLGFHTDVGMGHHVTIDLGQVHRIRQVVVYNRADCCPERAVPLALELSTDGQTFRQVAQRLDPFERWRVKLAPTDTRYVRLALMSGAYFHLAEVEVY